MILGDYIELAGLCSDTLSTHFLVWPCCSLSFCIPDIELCYMSLLWALSSSWVLPSSQKEKHSLCHTFGNDWWEPHSALLSRFLLTLMGKMLSVKPSLSSKWSNNCNFSWCVVNKWWRYGWDVLVVVQRDSIIECMKSAVFYSPLKPQVTSVWLETQLALRGHFWCSISISFINICVHAIYRLGNESYSMTGNDVQQSCKSLWTSLI